VRTITLAGLVAATLVAGLGVIGSAGPANAALAAAPAARTASWPLSGGGSAVSQDDRSISCGSPTACLAVGTTGGSNAEASAVALDGTQLEGTQLEGTQWKTVPVPLPKKGQISYSLDAVSCKTAAYCLVTGGYVSNQTGSTVPYLLTWNGTALALIPPPPVPRGHTLSTIDAVSCVAVRSCVVFGTATYAVYHQVELAWTWNGSKWAAKGPAFPADPQNLFLGGADCFSLTSCEVVGGSATTPLAGLWFAAWNGRKFTLQRSAVPTSGDLRQSEWTTGVSCASRGRCVAVVWTSFEFFPPTSYLVVWNGKMWTTPSEPESGDYEPAGVSCMPAANCLAVGYHSSGGVLVGGAVSLVWNGRKWRNIGVPGVGRGVATYFYDVSCPKTNRCVAIGMYSSDAHGHVGTLAGYWNGKNWKLTGA
jgi:hypothetical protein